MDALANGISDSQVCRDSFSSTFDLDWSRNPFDLVNSVRAIPRVREIVERGHYDLVHVHTPVASFITRLALRELRCSRRMRVVYTAHGFHFYDGGPKIQNACYLALEKLAGRWTDFLVVINLEDEVAARKHRIVAPECIRYMQGIGVDTTRYAPSAVPEESVRQLRAELGLLPSEQLLVMIAEFNPGKRHVDAVEALSHLGRSSVHLAFAGTGVLLDEIRARANALGIRDRVHFLGFRTDIPVLLRAADASLLPSEREGLPRSIMESMALGTPVIGTDIRGIRDLLSEGAGFLVPVGDPRRLAGAMQRVIDYPDEARAVAELAKERVKAFDLQRIIALHEALYAEALRGTGRTHVTTS